jgi:glycosyltransferase involved in cell wall biosynthesis
MRLTHPKVSIIMPCFRMGAFVSKALGSVKGQTYTNWELIAIDDCGPEDGTSEAVSAFASDCENGRINLIRHETNRGVGAARNTGLNLATGELVAFLDPDDYWMPDYLQVNIFRFATDPAVDLLASPVILFSDEANSPNQQLLGISQFESHHFPQCLAIGNPIQPSATVVRTSILRSAGGFTTSEKLQHVEDWDLWIRLVKSGAAFEFLSRPLAYYRRHAGSAMSDESRVNRLISNLIDEHRAWFDVNQLRFLKTLSYEVNGLRQHSLSLNRPSVRLLLKIDQLISNILKPIFRSKS